MLHHVLPTVFLTYRDLHPTCRPAHVVRSGSTTLVMLDPSCLRVELAFWAQDHLTDAERITVRSACGLDPDLRQPIPDDLLDGELGKQEIVGALRLPELVPARQTA